MRSFSQPLNGTLFRALVAVAAVLILNLPAFATPGVLDTSFNPDVGSFTDEAGATFEGAVYSIAVQSDGKILIGGRFGSVGGVPRTHLARLDQNGGVDPTFVPGLDALVYSVVVEPAGTILIGGQFANVTNVQSEL